jgi:glutamate racemase
MVAENIDYLVLGCSHYPYLIPKIKKIIPNSIKIIDSGEAVARQTQHVLNEKIGLNNKKNSRNVFFTNSNPKVLSSILGGDYEVISKDF